MKKKTIKTLSLVSAVCLLLTLIAVFELPGQRAEASSPPRSSNVTENPIYAEVPNADLAVGTFVAAYNAAGTNLNAARRVQTIAQNASFDNTSVIQNLIDKIYMNGGGTLYIPAGQYRVNGTLTIRRGVTLRGDWVEPVRGEQIDLTKNTVLLAYRGRGINGLTDYADSATTAKPCIEMEIESCVANVTIYYPEQTPDNIVSYSPAIVMGCRSYFGNEYCNVRDVTLVNPWVGVQYNYYNGGAAPVINGVYGSPLKLGVEVDAIADVGRIENLHFSPDYWIFSGFNATAFATEPARKALRDYVYANGVGVSMRRNDWSYTCYVDVDGYNIGFRAHEGFWEGTPNGHHYGFNLTGCKTGVQVDKSAGVGIMFTDIKIVDCEEGFVVSASNGQTVQLVNADITASRNAVRVESGMLLMNGSIVRKGTVLVNGGVLNALGNRLENNIPQVTYGLVGRAILTDNTFTKPYMPDDNSIYAHEMNNTPGGDYKYENIKAPPFPNEIAKPLKKAPLKTDVYVVSTANRVAFMNSDSNRAYTTTSSTADSTTLIQNKLDEAAAAGGGVVFLPPGKYKVSGSITIPYGVELRGSGAEIASPPHGTGSVLEIWGNRNNPGGDPAVIMEARSGMRGIVFNYPEQSIRNVTAGKLDVKAYPYAIQGRGDNIYLANIGVRAVYNAMDFDTYRCDNLYIDGVSGHVFNKAIKYGNDGEGAIIKNVMANVIIYACGEESKFGGWDNSFPTKGDAYAYSYEFLDFMEIGDCKNIYLYNNFHFGSWRGLHYVNQGNGGPQNANNMGLGVDGSRQSIVFDTGLTGTCNFINSQIVALQFGYTDATYMVGKADSDFTANFYATDFWGGPNNAFDMEADTGTINHYAANVDATGDRFLKLEGGALKFINSRQNGGTNVLTGSQNWLWQIASPMRYTDTPALQKIGSGSFNAEDRVDEPETLTYYDRTGWTASSAFDQSRLPNVLVDGTTNATRWTTGPQNSGTFPRAICIDMGKDYVFNTINALWDGGDWPRDLTVYAAPDSATGTLDLENGNITNWGSPIFSSNSNVTNMEFDLQTARYIMLRQAAVTGQSGYWSILGLKVGLSTSPYFPRYNWEAKAKVVLNSDNNNNGPQNAINGSGVNTEYKQGPQNIALPNWWMVDLGSVKTFNTITVVNGGGQDNPGGGGDYPRDGIIRVATDPLCFSNPTDTNVEDGTYWTTVATSCFSNGTNAIDVGTQTARYIMILRPGDATLDGLYWAMKDFKISMMPNPFLSRGTWNAKANVDNGNAYKALVKTDNSTNSQWNYGPQNGTNLPGWWMVDLGKNTSFNTLILKHGGYGGDPQTWRGGDWPQDAIIRVGTNAACWSDTTNSGVAGANWTTITSPEFTDNTKPKFSDGVNVIDVGNQTARYVMILRPTGAGNRGNYWAMTEFNLAQTESASSRPVARQASPLGYTMVSEPGFEKIMESGSTYKFKLDIAPDFMAAGTFDVFLNGATSGHRIYPDGGGVYTIDNISVDQVISVGNIIKKSPQTIAFPNDNAALNMVKGTSRVYPITVPGAGTGPVTYESANPLIATVNPTTGQVTAVNIGTTVIRAFKAADNDYASAEAEYIVMVTATEIEPPPPLEVVMYARGYEPGITVFSANGGASGRVERDPAENGYAFYVQSHATGGEGYEIEVRNTWGMDISAYDYIAFDIMATNTALLQDIGGLFPRICNGGDTEAKQTQYQGASSVAGIKALSANTWKTVAVSIKDDNVHATNGGGVDKTDVTAVRLRLLRTVKTALPGTLYIRNVRFQTNPSASAPAYEPTVPKIMADDFNGRNDNITTGATAPDRYEAYKVDIANHDIFHINYTNGDIRQDWSAYEYKYFVFEMYVTDESLLQMKRGGNNWFIMVGEQDAWNDSCARLKLNVDEIRAAAPRTWVRVSAQLARNNTSGLTFAGGTFTNDQFSFSAIRKMGLQFEFDGPRTGEMYIRNPRFQDNPFDTGEEAPTASNPIITSR
ncbi:MAG: Ig-like domain-containing protein, partial [Oscillospiraceae bacterium]|nr:Ig-like domain-containing protein [Oscillospiraceae bacterium]